jgi:integration host factor subunit alpha
MAAPRSLQGPSVISSLPKCQQPSTQTGKRSDISSLVTEDAECRSRLTGVGKAVTRVRLYDAVYQKVGLSRSEASALVELVLKEIADSVARGEAVKLSSFGTFTVRKKGQRMGRNPKTGVDVPISSRRVVVFKASAVLKQRINGEAIIIGSEVT